jgi:enoyl-CoA hydratase
MRSKRSLESMVNIHNETDGSRITVEQNGGVRSVYLNRPEKRNALTPSMLNRLVSEFEDAAVDPGTSVILLQGTGKDFCAGYDLGAGEHQSAQLTDDLVRVAQAGLLKERLWQCPIPVIAAVHGHCLAGGTDLALLADLLMVSDGAMFGHPAVRSLGTPSAHMWLYRAGPQWSKRLLFTGDVLRGNEIVEAGIALTCCPEGDLSTTAFELAQRIALVPKDLLVANKRVINSGIDLMGRASLWRIAQTEESIAHFSTAGQHFRRRIAAVGVAQAVRERDAPFIKDDER